MNTLSAIFIAIISLYLSGVTAFADFLNSVFLLTPATQDSYETVQLAPTIGATEAAVDESPTDTYIIPKILLENSAYQKASIIESIPPETATSTAYDALVNVYCEHRVGNRIKVTTGTGFFIDTAGIILTNAHVAHFLLMDDIIGDSSCVIRAGNPAVARYTAELLYIPPAWVQENADMFTSANPTGTGERDYALLYVTGGVDGAPMPGRFPALPFDTTLMKTTVVGETVYAAGYPADSLMASRGRVPLVPKLATTSIAELMTFGSNYADVFTVTGTEVGEQGASGGPVVTTAGKTIGLISTKGDNAEFGEGALRAITMSYIDRTITEETGYNLRQNLGGNVPFRAQLFNDTLVPFLRLLLEQEL